MQEKSLIEGLFSKILADRLSPAFEHLLSGDRLALALIRVRALEEADEEVAQLLGLAPFGAGS